MSDEMKPFLDDPNAPSIAELLRSADLDVPPRSRTKQDRLLAAAATSLSFETASRLGPAAYAMSHARTIGVASVVVIAVLAGVFARSQGGRSTPAAVAAHATTSETARAVAEIAAPPANEQAPSSTPSLRVDELPSAPAPSQPEGGGHTLHRPTTSVADELSLIDAARGALARGTPRVTLARVADYRAAFRQPHFADEADALEVSALAALGDRAAARAKAERFGAVHPNSPYLERVRSAVGAVE